MTKRKASTCEGTCCKRLKKSDHDQILWVTKIDELKRISEDAVQLAVWHQKRVPKFCKKFSDISAADLPQFEGMMKPGDVKEVLKAHLWCHHDLRSRRNRLCEEDVDELVQHINELAHAFAQIFKEFSHTFFTRKTCSFPLSSRNLSCRVPWMVIGIHPPTPFSSWSLRFLVLQ